MGLPTLPLPIINFIFVLLFYIWAFFIFEHENVNNFADFAVYHGEFLQFCRNNIKSDLLRQGVEFRGLNAPKTDRQTNSTNTFI